MSVETVRAGLRWALLLLLVLAPLPFGSVEPWAVLTLELWAAVVGAVALALVLRDPAEMGARARWALGIAGTIVAIGVIQLAPLPGIWARLVAAPTHAVRAQIGGLMPGAPAVLAPQSLEPPATTDALMRLVAYLLIGFAAAVAVKTPAHLRQVAAAIVVSGAFQAIYGSAEYLTGHQHIFGYAKRYYADEASGTFINRNHFAGYLAMTLPFALGLMLDGARALPKARLFRERILTLGESGGLRLLLGGTAAAAIWIGVLLSYSRGGLAVALAGTAFLAFRLSLRRSRAGLLATALLIPTALLMWQQVRAPGERFVAESENITTLSGRVPVWRASLAMIPDHWALGTGFGTFESAFAAYRPPTIMGAWDHAHSDWIEALTEGGPLTLAGCALLLVAIVGRRSRGDDSWGDPFLALSAASAAIVTTAIFGFTDFSLRIPAAAMLLAIALTVATASATDSHQRILTLNGQNRGQVRSVSLRQPPPTETDS